jgi:hypothetical protein
VKKKKYRQSWPQYPRPLEHDEEIKPTNLQYTRGKQVITKVIEHCSRKL